MGQVVEGLFDITIGQWCTGNIAGASFEPLAFIVRELWRTGSMASVVVGEFISLSREKYQRHPFH